MGKHFVIGDLHGCYNALIELLEKMHITKEDKVYFVGDIFDRAPSAEEQFMLIEWCLNNVGIDKQFSMVLGNHEYSVRQDVEALADGLKDSSGFVDLKSLREALVYLDDSYGTYGSLVDYDINWLGIRDFINILPLFIKLEVNNSTYIITHSWLCDKCGNDVISTYVPNSNQTVRVSKSASIWSRDFIDCEPEHVVVIHGHTRTISHRYDFCNPDKKPIPIRIGNNINIDTACFQGKGVGNLTAYCIEDDAFIQLWD